MNQCFIQVSITVTDDKLLMNALPARRKQHVLLRPFYRIRKIVDIVTIYFIWFKYNVGVHNGILSTVQRNEK